METLERESKKYCHQIGTESMQPSQQIEMFEEEMNELSEKFKLLKKDIFQNQQKMDTDNPCHHISRFGPWSTNTNT